MGWAGIFLINSGPTAKGGIHQFRKINLKRAGLLYFKPSFNKWRERVMGWAGNLFLILAHLQSNTICFKIADETG